MRILTFLSNAAIWVLGVPETFRQQVDSIYIKGRIWDVAIAHPEVGAVAVLPEKRLQDAKITAPA